MIKAMDNLALKRLIKGKKTQLKQNRNSWETSINEKSTF